MSVYGVDRIGELLGSNSYPGRGIVIGKSEDGTKAAFAYFIMGRSENSRNRVFAKEGENVKIYPFDADKVEDPSLIIYYPVRRFGDKFIVTNGDQTDTVYEGLEKGLSFSDSLKARCFEPDAPNLTPRISGILDLNDGFCYSMSILKSADKDGTACNRYTFDYEALNGLGHFIHTYRCDGNPIPTFTGEPERVAVPDDIDAFADEIWNNLDATNKVSLYVCYIDVESKTYDYRLINKNA